MSELFEENIMRANREAKAFLLRNGFATREWSIELIAEMMALFAVNEFQETERGGAN